MIIYPLFGALAQLVAHNTGSVGVRSSNLLCSTIVGGLIFKASRFCFWKTLLNRAHSGFQKQSAKPYGIRV